jgi:parallel beta-helix repeat protein
MMSNGNLVIDGTSVSYSGTVGISNDGDITLTQATVDNNGTLGVSLNSAATLTISDSSVSGNATIGISADGATVVISGSTFDNNGNIGLELYNCTLDVDSSTVEGTGQWGFDLHSNSGSITNCYVARNGGLVQIIDGGVDSLSGNIFEDSSGMQGVRVTGASSNLMISGNSFSNNWDNLNFQDGATGTVDDNDFSGCEFPLTINGAVIADVTNNSFTGAGNIAVRIDGGAEVDVSGNDFFRWYSVEVEDGMVDIADNVFNYGGNHIQPDGANANTIVRNNWFVHGGMPISAANGSYNLIHNNLVTGGALGFRFSGSTGVLYNNTIVGNGAMTGPYKGVFADGFSTLIAKNNIITRLPVGIQDGDDTVIEDVSHNDVWGCR